MPEQGLDLLQLATALMTQVSARGTEVVRHHIAEGMKPCKAIRTALLIARKIGRSVIFASALHFEVQLHPGRAWNGPDMTILADEIGEHPGFFALLQILNTERGHFRAT